MLHDILYSQEAASRDLKPNTMSLQLADSSVKYPLGILEDVPLQVEKFFIPCDFVVMDYEGRLLHLNHPRETIFCYYFHHVRDENVEFYLP